MSDKYDDFDPFMRAIVECANRKTSSNGLLKADEDTVSEVARSVRKTPWAAAVAGSILVAETCALAEGHAETRRRGPRAGDAFATMPY